MLFIDVLTVSPATLRLVSPGLCVDFFDTAPPPHDLLAGALTQLFFLRPAKVLQVFILWPLSGEVCHTIILATDLRGIRHTIMSTTDPGGIRDPPFTCTDLTEICHRADSTADLGELCCKSYDLPDPLIPALPSYESTGLPASCAFRPMTGSMKAQGQC
ncbi:uncharacterized protein UHOD_11331 [Ustilago sp. UG-2017b]|nr:uncharacterized protein UHOD_11331 [Ustilago sp. UG-2017b]